MGRLISLLVNEKFQCEMPYKEHYKKLSNVNHVIDHVNTKQIITFFDKKEEYMRKNYCNWFSRNKFSEFLTQMGWTYTEYKELRQPNHSPSPKIDTLCVCSKRENCVNL